MLTAVHLLAYSYVFGATSFHSFVSSVRAFKVLPRKEFGLLQSKLFPIHFLTQSIGPVVVGLSAPYTIPTVGIALLAASSLSGLTNYLWLLPVCNRLKTERFALEDLPESERTPETNEKIAALTKQFGKYHGISLVFNTLSVLTLAAYSYVFSTQFLVRALK
ncbi:putative mitochondrial outer membrane protein [Ogataea parapolymorpha DL-1]|uniref:Mitochondrial outer membrane protein n=1 Tax=Ogataea parapolymorpha (strain ATCC 26012 / BCRC 20466 / JCM 22074 / NRRL Y-7560 / DL-1) TaxID=871575 RepID=W1Q6R5_OGAPD|nr:putative mitochondrial outer membrane protein [Ogataea parapolymorpha DL-1]ESW95784.1 putative mitochondrial outer membrane protein [Ogataea parapolymorpha DL-1]